MEAKNSDNRDALRQAIGQLYDCHRFHHPSLRLAAMLPYHRTRNASISCQAPVLEQCGPMGQVSSSAHGAFI
jgi:hypothetical protein